MAATGIQLRGNYPTFTEASIRGSNIILNMDVKLPSVVKSSDVIKPL